MRNEINLPTDYATEFATEKDFARWAEKAARMSLSELEWAREDCRKARECANEIREGSGDRYLDEANTYTREIHNRS